jgi:MraZ protein
MFSGKLFQKGIKRMLFRGRILRNLDSKGRLMLPQEITDVFLSAAPGGKMLMTSFIDKCIALYTAKHWYEVLEKELSGLNILKPTLRNLQRIMLSAEEIQTDAQGRIRIPKALMEYAGIKDSVVLVGQPERIELWQPDRLATEPINHDFDDLAACLGEGRTLHL